MEGIKITKEQYEAEKAGITADYLVEKKRIADEYNARLADVEDIYREEKGKYHEEMLRLHREAAEAKKRYESEVAELKLWLLVAEKNAAANSERIDELRLRYREARLELMETRDRWLNDGERKETACKADYGIAVQNWKQGVRCINARRKACENEALRVMVERIKHLPKPVEITEENN